MPIDALSVLCVQLTRDLVAIAKFLFSVYLLNALMLTSMLLAGNLKTSDFVLLFRFSHFFMPVTNRYDANDRYDVVLVALRACRYSTMIH